MELLLRMPWAAGELVALGSAVARIGEILGMHAEVYLGSCRYSLIWCEV